MSADFDTLMSGLSRSRSRFSESLNAFFGRKPKLDDDFYDNLEETLILSDMGVEAAEEIIASLKTAATRQALPDAEAVMALLEKAVANAFVTAEEDLFGISPVIVLFVGINGAGKTTTVGKLAYSYAASGRNVLIGSGDTFRAAAIEQLDTWAERANVPVIKRERGADPASVCFEVVEAAEACGADLTLIDTAGRLHTSADLMRELAKVVQVTRKRAKVPVKTVLVIDAVTGQNGLVQAREFNEALGLDGIIMTKLDGTAKGGIALAVSRELDLPILRIGVGEQAQDLQVFDPLAYAKALVGRE